MNDTVITPEAQAAADAAAQAKIDAAAAKAEAKKVADAAKAEAKAKADAAKAEAKQIADAARAEVKAKKEAEKLAAKEAKEAAAKAAAEQKAAAAAIEKPAKVVMPQQHGITRPKADGACGKVWAIADAMSSRLGQPVPISMLSKETAAAGLNDATTRTQYARWKTFNGVFGAVAKPAEAVVEAAPVAAEATAA